MEYSVRVWFAMQGDVVPLTYVAHAMARHTATGHGTLPVHGPTLKNVRNERSFLLLDAANRGLLTVCDSQGRITTTQELADDAQIPINSKPSDILLCVYAKAKHLIEWGESRGDVFHFIETPGQVVEWDLKDMSGKVLEAGYNRGFVGGGESEPFVAADVPASRQVEAATVPTANNKTHETLKFESAVHTAMTSVWNDWKVNNARRMSLKEPTKGEMHAAALNKLIDQGVQGKLKRPTLSMVCDAAKTWKKPGTLKLSLSPSVEPKEPKQRHPFKGEE